MQKTKQFQDVRPLFHKLEAFQPMCTAVLEGVWPGTVWVDDPENPRSALLVTFLSGGGAAWCFLAGNPQNQEFNRALNKSLFDEKFAGKEVGTFLVTCSPPDWGGNLAVIGDPRQPAAMRRRHYVCRTPTYDWRASLREGYTIQPMDIGLLQRDDLQLPSEVKTTLGKWHSIKNEKFQDYGFIAVHENQVVAWATVDFVTQKSGDLGFETRPEHRQRGLGSAVAAAALEYGIAKDIEVHWTCAEDNLGSQRSAEKLGLDREHDYAMHLFFLDLHTHMAQVAYSKLASGQHREAIALYEQLFAEQADAPVWAYFDTAQAYAALGEAEAALKYLRLAAKEGWSAVEMAEQASEFEILHGTPEWAAILDQIRRQQKS